MDTDLVRTFIEVHRARHFGRAAERLFVTPAAVSARIRLLEDQLGSPLFTRTRNNIRLTPAGQRFLPHAENLLRSLSRAMLSVGTGSEHQEMVALGCLQSIWSVLLRGWVGAAYAASAELLLQFELLTSHDVVARVREQTLDFGLVYEPPRVGDLAVESVATLALLLVATEADRSADRPLPGYVHVDWGSTFSMSMSRALPQLPEPSLRVDSVDVALEFLYGRGGAAYLPRPVVADALRDGRLHPVRGAPTLTRPVYLIESVEVAVSPIRATVRGDLVDWLARASAPQ